MKNYNKLFRKIKLTFILKNRAVISYKFPPLFIFEIILLIL